MAFMKPVVEHGLWLIVETSHGDTHLPADLWGHAHLTKPGDQLTPDTEVTDEGKLVPWEEVVRDLVQYTEVFEADDIYSVELREGFGARFSAPGYMDCTEWTVYDTREEAEQALREEAGDDEEEEADDE